jgi:starch-binding outer membrane protein, SusD/RagB family
MKKTFSYLLILLCSGCAKSFLNKTPSNSIPLDQALTTPVELNQALNGAYAALRNTGVYGANFLISGDVQADNVYVETSNIGVYVSQYTYTVLVNDPVPAAEFTNAYIGILRANQVINASINSPSTDTIKSQAYAIRALLYFKLVTIFATSYTTDTSAPGVPLVLTYNPDLLPKRNTVGEVYTQIVSDLRTALKSAPGYVNSVLLSRYAIEALLAKVYLYEGDNTNAKSAAADVINAHVFTLASPANYNAFWSNPAIQTDANEVLFEVDVDQANNNGSQSVGSYYINGFQELYASSQLYNLYSATDIRRTLLIPGLTKSGDSAYLVNKFPNAQNADPDNLKVIRLAEVYLIAAESSLPANEGDAIMYLNALMANRDPGFPYALSGPALLNAIVLERRKELAFEGDRLYDMNRLQLPINRIANPGALPLTSNQLSIPFPDYRRIAPIPQAEINANPNIASQQNQGY